MWSSTYCVYCVDYLLELTINFIQGESGSIYADIKHVNNRTTSRNALKREQLRKPIRITVTKSDVLIRYPLRYIDVRLREEGLT